MPQDKADTEDPMAYLAFAVDGSESCAVYLTDGEAEAAAEAWGWQVMPLYLAARLTDAERKAVEAILGDPDLVLGDAREPLRGLLERMSGPGQCGEAGQ